MTAAAADAAPYVSAARKWWALGYGGFLATISSWALVAGIIGLFDSFSDEFEVDYNPTPWLIVALLLAPAAFGSVAWATRRPGIVKAVALATGLLLAFGYVILLLARDPITAAVAGYAAGAAVSLRPERGHGRRARAIAALAITLYVFIMARTALLFALAFGPMLAFLVMGAADMLMERRLGRMAEKRAKRVR